MFFLIHIYLVLIFWKKRKYFWKNHGKFMEYDSGIRLETLYISDEKQITYILTQNGIAIPVH